MGHQVREHAIDGCKCDTCRLERVNAAKRIAELETRQQELLASMVRLTRETPYPEEVSGRDALIAEVGTLRARVRELEWLSVLTPASTARYASPLINESEIPGVMWLKPYRMIEGGPLVTTNDSNGDLLVAVMVDTAVMPGPSFEVARFEAAKDYVREHMASGFAAGILELARRIGQHWRDQQGVNGALLDELAEVTR